MKTTFTIALLAYITEALRDNGLNQMTLAEIEMKSLLQLRGTPIAYYGIDTDDLKSYEVIEEEERAKQLEDDEDPVFYADLDESDADSEDDNTQSLAQTRAWGACWEIA